MKRVLFASNNLNIGGMEKSLVALIKNIDSNKFQVFLLLESKEGKLLDEIPSNVKIIEYRLNKSKFILYRKIRNALKFYLFKLKYKNKFDFSCCYATYSLLCNKIALICSKNNLLYIHSNYYEYFNRNIPSIINWAEIMRIKDFKKIAFVSNESMHNLISVLPHFKDKFILLGNLFDSEEIKIKSKQKKIVKPKNKIIFIFIGRLEEDSKKITRMIETFKIISETENKFELWIIGKGKDSELYYNLIEKYNLFDYIKLLGEKSNPYPFFVVADYILLFSDYEGFPVIYNETFCLGKRLITTINLSDDFINIEKMGTILIHKDAYLSSQIILKEVFNTNIKKPTLLIDYDIINKNRIKNIENIMIGD